MSNALSIVITREAIEALLEHIKAKENAPIVSPQGATIVPAPAAANAEVHVIKADKAELKLAQKLPPKRGPLPYFTLPQMQVGEKLVVPGDRPDFRKVATGIYNQARNRGWQVRRVGHDEFMRVA